MNTDDVFATATMAKIHADQGNLLKAAEIYRYLLQQEPERHDLMEALSEIEKKIAAKDPENLVSLFCEWIDLLFMDNKVKKLKKLQQRKAHGRKNTFPIMKPELC